MRSFLLLLCAASAFAADIPAGSHVLLRLQNSINSRTAQPGDFVYLQTATPIAVDGNIVVPVGSHVQGVIAEVNRGGRVKGKAELAISLESLVLTSGQQFKFSPRVASVDGDPGGQKVVDRENTIQQGANTGRDTARIAILTGFGTFIGARATRFSRTSSVGMGAGIGAGSGFAVGLATTAFTRGRDVDLRQGASLDVVFEQAVPLE